MEDAAGILEDQAAVASAQVAAVKNVGTLFDGMPEDQSWRVRPHQRPLAVTSWRLQSSNSWGLKHDDRSRT